MRKITLLLTLLLPSFLYATETMRVDYYHTGNSKQEFFSLDKIVIEPTPWPGNPKKMIDDTNLGKYFFEVIDQNTKQTTYSRGFASVYGEWETTDEAEKINRTFGESLRFPSPSSPVRIVLKKRDKKNAFQEIWNLGIDPKDMFIDRAKRTPPAPLVEIEKNGDPETHVDFLILGDGYMEQERGKFEKDARRFIEILFTKSPFKERRKDFNIWGLCPASPESGISRPSTGVYKHTPVGATYDAFGSERYVLTFDNRSFREIASFAPYEVVEILTNSNTYGGGGIFGQYSTVAADSKWGPYVFVHEFGHHIAALADEYYTSAVAYQPATERVEPWEVNATALLDPENLKWKDLVTPGTPIPTSWRKEEFEKYTAEFQKKRHEIRAQNKPESVMDTLFEEELKRDTEFLGGEKYAGRVGAFEGANYEAKGYYRPQADCIMFTRDEVPFCKVCQRGINRVIDLYTAK